MASGKAVQVLSFQNDRPFLDVQKFTKVLKKVGDRPVAIVSVNGPIRSGKSFLLNFLMRQALLLMSKNNEIESVLTENYGFKWRGGRERMTIGIDIWSEPFIVKDRSDNEVGVILMDTQGLFDPQTEFSANTLIFCVSVWLSSVFIYNIKGEVSEDRLQFIEFFTNLSSELAKDDEESRKIFQKMIILIRDWQNQGENSYGLHRRIPSDTGDDTTWSFDPKTKNFIRDFFMDTVTLSEEAIETRRELLDGFEDVSACLLPHPGKEIAENKDGVARNMDADFEEQIIKLVGWVLCSECLVPKMINEITLTGNSFIPFIEKWAKLVSKEKMSQVKNINAANAEATLSTHLLRTQKAFDEKLKRLSKTLTTTKDLQVSYQMISTETVESFKSGRHKSLLEKYDKKGNFVGQLKKYMQSHFENTLPLFNECIQVEMEKGTYVEKLRIIEKQINAIVESLKIFQQQNKSNVAHIMKVQKLENDHEAMMKSAKQLREIVAAQEKKIQQQKLHIEYIAKNGRKKFRQQMGMEEPSSCSIL